MAQHGKKYNAAASSFDSATQHGSTEAVTKVKTLASAKFDETVELSVRLGVDPRKADQMVVAPLPFRPAPAPMFASQCLPPAMPRRPLATLALNSLAPTICLRRSKAE